MAQSYSRVECFLGAKATGGMENIVCTHMNRHTHTVRSFSVTVADGKLEGYVVKHADHYTQSTVDTPVTLTLSVWCSHFPSQRENQEVCVLSLGVSHRASGT